MQLVVVCFCCGSVCLKFFVFAFVCSRCCSWTCSPSSSPCCVHCLAIAVLLLLLLRLHRLACQQRHRPHHSQQSWHSLRRRRYYIAGDNAGACKLPSCFVSVGILSLLFYFGFVGGCVVAVFVAVIAIGVSRVAVVAVAGTFDFCCRCCWVVRVVTCVCGSRML